MSSQSESPSPRGSQLATRYAEKVIAADLVKSRHGIGWQLQPVASPDDVLLALGELESMVRQAAAEDVQQQQHVQQQQQAAPGVSLHTHERPLIDEWNQPFAGQATVSRRVVDALAMSVGAMESTLGKEKLAAHVAVDINPLLASTRATLHATLRLGSKGKGRIGGRQRSTFSAPPVSSLISDQRAVHAMADSLPPVPLVPAVSISPPASSGLVAHPFQDASERFGMGGFFLDEAAG